MDEIKNNPASDFIEEVFLTILNRDPTERELKRHVNHFRGTHNNHIHILRMFLDCKERLELLETTGQPRHYLFQAWVFYGETESYRVEKIISENVEKFPEFEGLAPEQLHPEMKRKKIALCLTGHTRDLDVERLVNNLVKPVYADIFIHAWDTYGNQLQHRPKGTLGPTPDEVKLSKEKLESIFNSFDPLPKGTLIESNEEFLEKISPIIKKNREKIIHYGRKESDDNWAGASDPKFILSQMHSWSACHSLVEDYEETHGFEYDHIIKLRLDFSPGIVTKNMLRHAVMVDGPDVIRIPDPPMCGHPKHPICTICCKSIDPEPHFHDKEVCDVLAHGNREVMRTYMTTFDFWKEILDEMHSDNNSLLNTFANSIEERTLNIKLEKMYAPWQGKAFRVCCDIRQDDNHKVNCFYPERFLLYRLKDLILKPSPIMGRVSRSHKKRKFKK